MGARPYLPSPPLTPHQDFAERNGFCTRSFFIIKLTVSTPSSRPRLLPGEATPPSDFRVGGPSQFGRYARAPGGCPHASVFLGWLRPQSFKHAPSDEGAAQVQAVISQQQFVVAHEWVRESAKADTGAQQERASLEVCDRDEPPARGRSQEERKGRRREGNRW